MTDDDYRRELQSLLAEARASGKFADARAILKELHQISRPATADPAFSDLSDRDISRYVDQAIAEYRSFRDEDARADSGARGG